MHPWHSATAIIQSYLKIASVDSFQGNERPLMIFNSVRTSSGSFFTKERLNVALTRAQHGMIIVGHPRAFEKGIFADLYNFYEEKNAIVSPSGLHKILWTTWPDLIEKNLKQRSAEQEAAAIKAIEEQRGLPKSSN
jgi:hypothetical protein